MKLRRRLRITVTHRKRVVTHSTSLQAHCPVCRRVVDGLPIDQAAEFLRISGFILLQQIAAGRVHAIPASNEQVSICKESLMECGSLLPHLR
jgi:hypothetical protein